MMRFKDATKPLQYALSTRAECESIAHVVQVMTDRDPNCTVFSIDGARRAMMTAVHNKDQGEKFIPFLLQFYGHPSTHFEEGGRGTKKNAPGQKKKRKREQKKQTRGGQKKTRTGQEKTDIGQILKNELGQKKKTSVCVCVCLCVCVLVCLCRLWPRSVLGIFEGEEGEESNRKRMGASKGGGPKFRAFFHSPTTIFILFSSLWGSFRGIMVVFWSVGTSNVLAGVSHDSPRTPNVHI